MHPAKFQQFKQQCQLRQEVISACRELLLHSAAQEIKDYLDKRVSSYYQEKFQFGYFPDSFNFSLLSDKIDLDTLAQLELAKSTPFSIQSHFFSHNLIFPCIDEFGKVVGLGGRTILSKEQQKEQKISKYNYSYGKEFENRFIKNIFLYGLEQAKKSIRLKDYVIIVEGQIDLISLHAAGFHNVVALGGSTLSPYQLFLLKKYTSNIILLLDPDEAGKTAAQKIINKYHDRAIFKNLTIPDIYEDVDDYLHTSPTLQALDILL